jgi:phosphonate transport system substrate-binding protein
MTLHITSCQAPNAHPFGASLTKYVAQHLNLDAQFDIETPWQARLQQVLTGQIQIGWICGYPYVQKADEPAPMLELLAVPVMAGERYQNRPVYFSDVVVRQESPFFHFNDLRGAVWAYNEIGSQSGYHITRYKLAKMGENGNFFGEVLESGAHERSLQLILSSDIDGAPIDSTVLETELRRNPDLANQIRIIDTLGPSPIPPWVIHKSVPALLRQEIRQVLTQMHLNPAGQAILSSAQQLRFDTAVDADYDPIRKMLNLARAIHL